MRFSVMVIKETFLLMGKIKTPELTPIQESALGNGYRKGASHAFRNRHVGQRNCSPRASCGRNEDSTCSSFHRILRILTLPGYFGRCSRGKWLQPRDGLTSDTLSYAANRALADMGKDLVIKFKNHVA